MLPLLPAPLETPRKTLPQNDPVFGDRITTDIAARYILDQNLINPAPQTLAIVDDVLTTGAHYLAVKAVLQPQFPDAKIVGLFIARRVPETTSIEDFFDPV